jgi:hypothetical protein
MLTFVLILFAHVGPLGDGNSNALTSVPGFASKAACENAGVAAQMMALNTVKRIEFVCVPTN